MGPTMNIHSLGHVFLKVRNQQRAEAFYNGVLGIPIVGQLEQPPMTFFSLGNHHDFGIFATGDEAQSAPAEAPGLMHVAFKVGDASDDLWAARRELEKAGLEVQFYDHGVTHSIYVEDPDGNSVELYVDVSDGWKTQPDLVALGQSTT